METNFARLFVLFVNLVRICDEYSKWQRLWWIFKMTQFVNNIQNGTICNEYSKWHNLWSIFKMAQFVMNIQNGTICDQYSKWHNLWSIFKMAARSNYAIWLVYHKSSIVKKKVLSGWKFYMVCNEDKKLENSHECKKYFKRI